MSTLYLHIGTPKTGTTAIQWFCLDNHEWLKQHGYVFPLFPAYAPSSSNKMRNGFALKKWKQGEDGAFENAQAEAEWSKLMRMIARAFKKYPNVILSEETIWSAVRRYCMGLWKNLKHAAESYGFDVRIIVYLRRQDEFFESFWAQLIRTDDTICATSAWEDMLAHPERVGMDYYAYLERIASVFGRDHIDVRVYEREHFPERNIVLDFLNAIGLSPDADCKMRKNDLNPSLSGNPLEIKLILNSVLAKDSEALQLIERAAMAACADGSQRSTRFTPEAREAFLQLFEESNRLVSRDYLGQDEPLFAPPAALPPTWTPDAAGMCRDIVRVFGLAMSRAQDQLWLHKRWRKFRGKLGRVKRAAEQKFRWIFGIF